MNWHQIRRAVAPVDLDDPDEQGVRLALEATGGDPAKTDVVVALAPGLTGDAAIRIPDARARLREWLAASGLPELVRTHVAVGRPADVVADVCAAVEADLVIVPSRSRARTGVQRLLVGSNAEEIVRRAPCAVLVVRHR
ncbi:MAG: universal stress protein [Myxococcota bacterium]